MKYIISTILWMCLIYAASADSVSVEHSQDLLKFAGLEAFLYIVRKGCHFMIFAVLAWLASGIFMKHRFWWISAFVLSAIYAGLDEYHQSFVPGRTALFSDVLIDSAGSIFGIFVFYVMKKKRIDYKAINSKVS